MRDTVPVPPGRTTSVTGQAVRDPFARSPLGTTGLLMSHVWWGSAALGGMPEDFGYDVPVERARATLRRVLAGPGNVIDTAPAYHDSERLIGDALAEAGSTVRDLVIVTKADRDFATGRFDRDQVRRSVAESCRRLCLDALPLVLLHDPEYAPATDLVGLRGAVQGLAELQADGLIGHLGVAGNDLEQLLRLIDQGPFEVALTHNRWTLVDRSANAFIDQATARGIAVVNAAPFGGGSLAKGIDAHPRYRYRAADAATAAMVAAIAAACDRWSVPLRAAALMFSLRDPRISATVVGVSRPERVDEIVEATTIPIPDGLWAEIDRIVGEPV